MKKIIPPIKWTLENYSHLDIELYLTELNSRIESFA